ncbi:thioredoxin domain-containing protein [Kordiimonas marina]|uniref:thioredoxin domain-containing protein n=1 Tax=Kordiimonas marina TaxID=2872312 RepID=UPI001FF42732|nr:thioredoxin domain-containing protein [Kordiimonas marina]MCJ9429403.1 DsbA family protein [Kordiimonas marina]
MTHLKRLAAALCMAVVPMFGFSAAHAADKAADKAAPAATVGLRGDIVYGKKDAPLVLIEYGSLTCPHCGHFANDVFPTIKKDYIDTGKVKYIFRNFILDRFDLAAAEASRCTSDPEKTKTMIATFYKTQKDWIMAENQYEAIAAIAAKSGVSKQDFAKCLTSDDLGKYLLDMRTEGAKKYKIRGVPMLILNGKEIKEHDLAGVKKHLDSGQ